MEVGCMSYCDFPENTGQTAYRKGCRCARCRGAKGQASANRPQRIKPCSDCGGVKSYGVRRCDPCEVANILRRTVDKIVVDDNGCWIFTGHRNRGGYGRISGGFGQRVTHQVTYEHFVGEIPYGLELDHVCRTPACCNPDHLEAVTHAENMRRCALWREAA